MNNILIMNMHTISRDGRIKRVGIIDKMHPYTTFSSNKVSTNIV